MEKRFAFSRTHIVYLHDVVMAALSFLLSLWLRLGDQLPAVWPGRRLLLTTVLFTLTAAVIFRLCRMYRGIWRYASVIDLVTMIKAVSLTELAYLPLQFWADRLEDFPRSLPVINWVVLILLLGGPRFLYRLLKDRRLELRDLQESGRRVPVLLVGAGDAADLFIRATRRPDSLYRPVGILTTKRARLGMNLQGVDVLGMTEDFDTVLTRLKKRDKAPERLILTDPDLDGGLVRRLLAQADAQGLTLGRLPRLTDLKSGAVDKVEPRPIDVEDLLGRPQATLDRSAMRAMIQGQRVIVTGAGGSIGSELVRQIADYAPEELVLLESSEFALYTIDQEVGRRWPDLPRRAVIADVRDRGRMDEVLRSTRPALLFHAAALKHVPMVEENPLEGVLTNAIGTRIVADACVTHGVRVMVQISTDKAVNPTNVMGASKRMAETYCQALDLQGGAGTRFVTVRFGNVLGSTGSVVPLFQKQMAAGGPITVTHPEMTRYFMTIREAVELVLQASVLGIQQGSRYQGRIFVLDMGEPVKIVDLARQMIRMAGLRPETDIKIVFSGLRPGEKLFEEIFHGAEAPVPTEAEGILVAAVRAGDLHAIRTAFERLDRSCRSADRAAMMDVLHQLVPEYQAPAVAAGAGVAQG